MKIIKTIGKYVKNGVTRLLSVFTTDYNVYSLEQSKYIDEVLADLVNKVDVLSNFCQPIKHTMRSVSGWTVSGLSCYTIGNLCIVSGVLGHNGALSGEYHINILPAGIAPASDVKLFEPVVEAGVEYKIRKVLTKDSTDLMLYFYDTWPSGVALPINFVFNMSTEYVPN